MKNIFILFLFICPFNLSGIAQHEKLAEGVSNIGSLHIEKEPAIPKPTRPPQLVIDDVDFLDADGNDIINAQENCQIVYTLRNDGAGSAYAVKTKLGLKNVISGLSYTKIEEIGTINPGESKKLIFKIIGKEELETGIAHFKIEVEEGNAFYPDAKEIQITTLAFQKPILELVDHEFGTIDGGVIKSGKEVTLVVVVQNKGQGIASKVRLTFQLPNENVFATSEKTFLIKDLQPGESERIDFPFFANRNNISDIPIDVIVEESNKKYGDKQVFTAVLDKSAPKTSLIVINGKHEPGKAIPEAAIDRSNRIKDPFGSIEDVLAGLPKVKKNDRICRALLIGNRSYNFTDEVIFAHNDVELMRNLLQNGFGYLPENIYIEPLYDATMGQMRSKLGSQERPFDGDFASSVKRKENADIFIFYSGHGIPDLQGGKEAGSYLMPVDAHPKKVSMCFALDELFNIVNQIPADRKFIFLDACFSGSPNGKTLFEGSGPVHPPKPIEVAYPDMVILTASQNDETANWYNQKQQGILTWFIAKAISEAKELDKDNNRELTVHELFNSLRSEEDGIPFYIRQIVPGSEQHPTLTGSPKAKNFTLLWY